MTIQWIFVNKWEQFLLISCWGSLLWVKRDTESGLHDPHLVWGSRKLLCGGHLAKSEHSVNMFFHQRRRFLFHNLISRGLVLTGPGAQQNNHFLMGDVNSNRQRALNILVGMDWSRGGKWEAMEVYLGRRGTGCASCLTTHTETFKGPHQHHWLPSSEFYLNNLSFIQWAFSQGSLLWGRALIPWNQSQRMW